MIDEKTVKRVAEIARLELNEDEIKKFSKELESIVNWFEDVDKIDTKNVEPSFHPVKVEDRFREDNAEKSFSKEQAFMNTKNKKDSFFLGPGVV